MRESATCSQCGHGYTYPAELDAKAGMRCTSCGVLIHVKTGLPFGEAPSSPSGQNEENGMKKTPALPPVKRKQPASSGRDADAHGPMEEILRHPITTETGGTVPAVSWLAWGLALVAIILAFIFPSYGNDSTDPLYMLQWLPSMIFGCTAAILFIQGLAAMRR
ncbi:hypothetical protein [uncultured Akkermansia sp.]|jgi:DNA-directed RNA polymerase subunit RPC12/RpoP|uniref:hypothetical protein n=1 Tax=uncultured Akkermansia sp. TaxID=512294 RepID=UPI0025F54259|nr:hypothetical protein [uncultured Akkermansia sp.]